MDEIINKSIQRTITYTEYRDLVADLLSQNKSTGSDQNDVLLNYSKLNNTRMKRLDKTIKLSDEVISSIQNLEGNYTWLVLTEGWCGDAAQTLPIINKIAEISDKINLKVALRGENEELMNQFLTNGNQSIPKLIAIDKETNTIVNSWGPRPSIATNMVADYKEKYGSLDAEFKKDLQIWYNKNKGENTQEDLIELIKAF